MSLFRAALDGLVPYEPGKPEEEVQRELGLDRVVKLASNEGPWGPFPAALEAMERCANQLNRYPDGGAFHLRRALAERHGVDPAHVVTGAGADALIGHLSLATLDPGDEVVTAWPSFISYVLDTLKLGAVPHQGAARRRPLRPRRAAGRDRPAHEARLRGDAEQPDRDDDDPRAARRLLRARPRARAHGARPGVLRVHRATRLPDGVAEYVQAGRRVLVLRTFSKIYGLAGLRIGYGVGPVDVIQAIGKMRRAFDVNTQAQVAALASMDAPEELAERRRLTHEGRRGARAHAPRARARAGGACCRELPLRRGRGRRAAAVRRAAPSGSDRAPDGRIRRAGSAADHRRHAGRERVLRRGARLGPGARRPSPRVSWALSRVLERPRSCVCGRR